MKKNWIRVLAGVLALAMLLTLAACGGKEDGSSQADSSLSSSQSEESGTPESSPDSTASDVAAGPENGEKYASIQAFLDDPTVKSQIDSMVEALASNGDMHISVTAQDSKLIYTFAFGEFPEGTDTAAVTAQLEEGMDDVSATFEGIAAQLKEVVEEENPTVVVTYQAADGIELFSKEFSAP